MNNKGLNQYLEFAIDTVYAAGKLTLGYFQTGIDVDFKADDTPVTVADKKAEQLIRSRIESKYRSHAMVGEEFGDSGSQSAPFRWFIDPIDGTKSFMRGIPLYAVLLGLEIEGTIEVGVVYFPGLDEILYAATGQGCYWNGRRTQVSQTDQLSRAIVSFSDPKCFADYGKQAAWERLKKESYYRAGHADAYGHALVATGRTEIMLDPIMNAWDCGPFPVILREAGGFFGDWNGNETIYAKEAISTSKKLLPQVLKIIQG
jgi:histidinol-phosphatase